MVLSKGLCCEAFLSKVSLCDVLASGGVLAWSQVMRTFAVLGALAAAYLRAPAAQPKELMPAEAPPAEASGESASASAIEIRRSSSKHF